MSPYCDGGKCDEDIRVKVPSDLKEQVSALAVINGMTSSEYVRDLLILHVHGHLRVLQDRSRRGGSGEDGSL